MINTAIFLDRDGTINEDVGDLCDIKKLNFIPGAIDALKILQKYFLLFIITNQSGINKGIFTEKEFLEFNAFFLNCLEKENIKIQKVYFCPHTTEQNCECKKPKIFFITEIKKKYNVDLNNSYTIGDHPHDVEMGQNAGTKSIYLLTGHGTKHLGQLKSKPVFVAKNLYDATLWILKNEKIQF
jgi:D-glycero-D-manno-heptose 1,7-bisphosphate phosphatase